MRPIGTTPPKQPTGPTKALDKAAAPSTTAATGAVAPATVVTGMDAPLPGKVAPKAIEIPRAESTGGPAATVAIAFDALKAPGGPTQSRLLSDGLDSWNARLDMIEGATKSLDATYFILEKDPYGFAFLGGLLKKQLEGVQVRLSTDAMADTFGKHGFKMPLKGKDYLQELVNHGAQAWVYHPISSRLPDLLHWDYRALASNHDKILLADEVRGITGGRNIAQDYFASPKDVKGAWRDMDVQVEGKETGAALKAAFDAELVNGDASHPVHKDLFGNWDKKDLQMLGAYEMMNDWVRSPALSEADKEAVRADPAKREAFADALVKNAMAKVQTYLPDNLKREPSKKDVEFLKEQALGLVGHADTRGSRASYLAGAGSTRATETKIIDQTSAASGQRINNMAEPLAQLVETAQKRIVIQNPYVVLTDDMLTALERASKRGVEITIYTNSPLSTDSDVTQAFFLDDWQMILQKLPTARIFVATGERKFHGKSAVIDDDQTAVTTYNLDLLSGFVNGEVGAVTKSKELADDLMAAYADDVTNKANGFIEYTIERDDKGNAVLKDGKPVRKFGPEEHLSSEMLETYRKKKHLWGDQLRSWFPYFKPLRHS